MPIMIVTHSIIRDPKNPGKWAYEGLNHFKSFGTVGGFNSAKDAKRAFGKRKKSI